MGFPQYIRKNIVTGLFVTIPLLVTLIIFVFVYGKLTFWSVDLIAGIPRFGHLANEFPFNHIIRVSALVFIVLALFFVGVGARNAIGKKLLRITDYLLLKLPMFNIIYSTSRHIIDAIRNNAGGGMFRKVVLIEYPRRGLYSIGFITSENNENGEIVARIGKSMISVFLPTTPNPTSGFLLLVPKEDLVMLDMTVQDAMRLIVSCGAVAPMPWAGTPSSNPMQLDNGGKENE